jgi:molybdate transport system substrate-binding protein
MAIKTYPMHRYKAALTASLLLLLAAVCPSTAPAQTLRVAVAANAQFASQALKQAFEKQYPAKVELVVSSSGKLTAQIENGAPYDVFLSADMRYPQALYEKGATLDTPRIYALGSLVLWSLKKIPDGKGAGILLSDGVRTIALANPATAPYGVAAVQCMKKEGIYARVKNKLVYGESIAQVNQYLLMGAADIVFTARSVVGAPHLKNKGYWIAAPPPSYSPIAQGAVILKTAK